MCNTVYCFCKENNGNDDEKNIENKKEKNRELLEMYVRVHTFTGTGLNQFIN